MISLYPVSRYTLTVNVTKVTEEINFIGGGGGGGWRCLFVLVLRRSYSSGKVLEL